jgi:DNA-binding NarL/FixJ family response regulator
VARLPVQRPERPLVRGESARTRHNRAGAIAVRVVVGEDQVLFRAGLVSLLSQASFDVVAQAGDADDLVRKASAHRPDIVVTDVRMPPTNTDDGLRAAMAIRARLPATAVLVLSQYVAEEPALALLSGSAEGVGYLLKDRVHDLDHFRDAVRRVAAGGSALDPEIVARLVGRRAPGPLDELTPREREVLGLMAEGRSNQGIAEALVVTDHAVEKHVRSIFQKLDLPAARGDHRRVLAVLAFLRDHGAR